MFACLLALLVGFYFLMARNYEVAQHSWSSMVAIHPRPGPTFSSSVSLPRLPLAEGAVINPARDAVELSRMGPYRRAVRSTFGHRGAAGGRARRGAGCPGRAGPVPGRSLTSTPSHPLPRTALPRTALPHAAFPRAEGGRGRSGPAATHGHVTASRGQHGGARGCPRAAERR